MSPIALIEYQHLDNSLGMSVSSCLWKTKEKNVLDSEGWGPEAFTREGE